MKWFNKLYEKKISATGLAVFRITFFLNLFFEVLHIYNYQQLYYTEINHLLSSKLKMSIVLLLWLISLAFLIFGFLTKISSILNYVFCVFVLSSFTNYEYHMHYTYVGIGFLSIVIPLSNAISIDSIIKTKDRKVSVLYYYLPVFAGVGLVYFDSIFHKLTSDIWMNGLGMWFPSSLPLATKLNDQWLLNQEFIMKFFGYLVFVFELLFVFLFWNKRLRLPFFIIGIALHLGIFFEYPLPHFALGVMAIYTLMAPVSFWDKLLNVLKIKLKTREVIRKRESRYKYVLKFIIIIIIFFQINTTLKSPLLYSHTLRLSDSLNLKAYYIKFNDKIEAVSRMYLGITTHGVFMDNHFRNYNHIISIYYKAGNGDISIPIVTTQGMPDKYLSGALWVNWTFRVNAPNLNLEKFKEGVKNYTSFWASKNKVDLNNAVFLIKVKKIDLPNWEWEKDYLTKQLNKPWQDAGTILWKNKEFELDLIKPIEDF